MRFVANEWCVFDFICFTWLVTNECIFMTGMKLHSQPRCFWTRHDVGALLFVLKLTLGISEGLLSAL